MFYDKSIPDFITYPAHVYQVIFGDGLSVDFEIYSEFTQEEALNRTKICAFNGATWKRIKKKY